MALPLKTTDQSRLYTAEEFMALPLDEGKRYQLVRGVIEEMSWPGGEHGLVTDNLYGALSAHVRANKLGRVLPTSGFELNIDPDRDTVRSPDLAFIPASRVPEIGKGAISFPPALAVEVLSPNDRPSQLNKKLQDYQAAGWDLVWVLNPDKRTVAVYRLKQSSKPIRTLAENDTLDGADILPGFTVKVGNLFE